MTEANLRFEFTTYKIGLNKIDFFYKLTNATNSWEFVETIKFDAESPQLTTIPEAVLHNICNALHLMLGISYWKLYCPSTIIINTQTLSKDQAKFWDTVYTKGLGEFFYRNNIHFEGLINFPFDESALSSQAVTFDRQDRSLIGIGGGKDSIVAVELLRRLSHDMQAYVLETEKSHDLTEEVIQVLNIGSVKVTRLLDKQLFKSDAFPNSYNGHIPISAIFAFIGILTAALYDYRYVVVGNERSASSENLIWNGHEINHQWSKSEEFESLLQNYVKKYITPSIIYFSLLRPLSEIQIVQLFSQYEEYFPHFSSCNRNFKVCKETGLNGTKWCGECPKCAFIFALLAAYLPKETMLQIFHKNLLADTSLIELYRELLGFTGKKPFECVGTFEETKVALYMIHEKGEYEDDVVMKMFVQEVLPSLQNIAILKEEVFSKGNSSLIPEKFKTLINI